MAEKLKLLGKNPRLILLSKAVIFGALLFWLWRGGGAGYSSLLLFLAISSLMYFKPLWNSATLWRSFLGLLILSCLAFATHRDFFAQSFLNLFPILGALIFYLIVGLKEYILVHRRFWHFLVFSLIFYQTLFFYFLFEIFFSDFFVLFPAAAGFMLISEFLESQTKAGRSLIVSSAAIFGLFIIESITIVRFLPFGFLNSANLVALGGLFFAELALNFYNGFLSRRILFYRVMLFLVLALLIFLTSAWIA